jgi:Bacterial archaeo-eukaryotic release factor family 11
MVQSHSLAVFAGAGGLRSFRLPNRLTAAMQVADRFYVKPLLRAVTFPQTAFVLALAEGSVRLLEVTPDLPTFAVTVPDLPKDAAAAAGKASITDRSPARRLQGTEGRKTLVRSYARAVDRALRPMFNAGDVPLVLAAAQPIEAIFRSVNSYPHLAGVVELDEQEQPGGYGVLDEIARRTFSNDGRVLAVRAENVPTGASAAAILRYPI